MYASKNWNEMFSRLQRNRWTQLNEEIDEHDPSIAKLQRVKGRIVGMLLAFFARSSNYTRMSR